MRLFYGWVIVGVGIVVTCIGLGTMMSLGVFLQPMIAGAGWSRTGISTAATLNFLAMGFGSFAWGTLSDRFGTRAVVLCGGVLLGLGLTTASQATSLVQFQLLFGVLVGLAAGAFYAPMIATTTRWFTTNRSLAVALVSAGLAMGSLLVAPLSRALISLYDWRTAMFMLGCIAWIVVLPVALLLRRPPAARHSPGRRSGVGRGRVHRRAGAALAAIRRHRAHAFRLLRRAFGTDLPHGLLRDRLRRAGDGGGHRIWHRGPVRTRRTRRVRADRPTASA